MKFVLTKKCYQNMHIYIYAYTYVCVCVWVCMCVCVYVCVCGTFSKFPDLFVQVFRIVVDTWKFSMLLPYILWDDWPIFMISGSKEQLQQELEYTLLKPDCHSWWISKMQSTHEDNLEESYAIIFCFKIGKKCHRNVCTASDCCWSIFPESRISFWVA